MNIKETIQQINYETAVLFANVPTEHKTGVMFDLKLIDFVKLFLLCYVALC